MIRVFRIRILLFMFGAGLAYGSEPGQDSCRQAKVLEILEATASLREARKILFEDYRKEKEAAFKRDTRIKPLEAEIAAKFEQIRKKKEDPHLQSELQALLKSKKKLEAELLPKESMKVISEQIGGINKEIDLKASQLLEKAVGCSLNKREILAEITALSLEKSLTTGSGAK